jgi:hypothetical protein
MINYDLALCPIFTSIDLHPNFLYLSPEEGNWIILDLNNVFADKMTLKFLNGKNSDFEIEEGIKTISGKYFH